MISSGFCNAKVTLALLPSTFCSLISKTPLPPVKTASLLPENSKPSGSSSVAVNSLLSSEIAILSDSALACCPLISSILSLMDLTSSVPTKDITSSFFFSIGIFPVFSPSSRSASREMAVSEGFGSCGSGVCGSGFFGSGVCGSGLPPGAFVKQEAFEKSMARGCSLMSVL